MNAPFVTNLRARKGTLRLAPEGEKTITVRVEMPDVWDVVRVEVLPGDQVLELKKYALDALYPEYNVMDDFIVKLRGWEILDETQSLANAGVVDGSILLVTFRRRRPVR
ncbi:MAG TPA: hypothetical protein VGM82_05820 [Gemmatimonadaceae bacterium]|jgi:hypothetical protein